jgi:flagellar hook protein FlgE
MPLTSFNAALTGLNNHALQINIIGNNLANINSTAYKASKASFAELLGGSADTSASGNPIQVGLGSFVPGVTPFFNQGSILYTGRATDAAISGNGFFVVATAEGQGYTRAGNFGLTRDGELVNSEGYKVLGYPAVDGVVSQSSAIAPIIVLKGGSLPPLATTKISIAANLDSRAATDSTFSAPVQIYDSLGSPHTLTVTFTKTGPTGWSWTATIPAVDTGGAVGDAPTPVGNGTLTFDQNGLLTAPATPADNPDLTISGLANGSAQMTVSFEIVDAAGSPRFTSYASISAVSSTNQNGYTSSVLKDISIDNKGIVSGVFENGQVQALAQLAIANFANVEGLLKFKGSTFVASGASGEPSIGAAGNGGRGTITGSSLEQSNVDIAQEFTNLIIAQRGYQANSRVISTTDELYQDAINLKR